MGTLEHVKVVQRLVNDKIYHIEVSVSFNYALINEPKSSYQTIISRGFRSDIGENEIIQATDELYALLNSLGIDTTEYFDAIDSAIYEIFNIELPRFS